MSRVVEHLAELTGYRDRDALDVTLVGAFKDLLHPEAVAIYRFVGEVGDERWLTRARIAPGDLAASADPLWSDLDSLPPLAAYPDRHACLKRQEAFTVAGSGVMSYFPLTTERDSVGVLEIRTATALSAEDLRLVGSILRIYRNFQGLLDYSERDSLTGLLNRKTFDHSFLRIAAQPPAHEVEVPTADARRPASPQSVAWLGVIDIDHFKRVNDGYGHLIGDEVLLLLSRLMRSSFRYQDHLYRFGGEEFVVLMRCISGDDAESVFERLRRNVEAFRFPQVGQITVSVGYTALRSGDSPASAFDRADKAVYHAKQNGRNQIRHHAALVAAGELADTTRDSDVELF
jgi:diguanylate cyclase (GGDEF)-like protein